MIKHQLLATKISLSFLWCFTGITSLFWGREVGYLVLAEVNIKGFWANSAILLGSFIDIVIGLWVITGIKQRLCCYAQSIVIVTYTGLLTVIDATFWLHPFGPITKNFPILVLIYLWLKNLEPGRKLPL